MNYSVSIIKTAHLMLAHNTIISMTPAFLSTAHQQGEETPPQAYVQPF